MSETTDDLEASSSFDDSDDRWNRLIDDQVWIDANGNEIPLEDMRDIHLFNLLWFLRRKGTEATGNPEEDGAYFHPDRIEPEWIEGFDELEWQGIKVLLTEYALRRFEHACEGKDDSETLGVIKGDERRRLSPDRRSGRSSLLDGDSVRERGARALARLQGNAGLRRARRT